MSEQEPEKQQQSARICEVTPEGPVEERGCTDIFCCILFILCSIGMLSVASMGWHNGRPWTLTAVFDSSGMCCGDVCDRFPTMRDNKYLYVTIPNANFMKYHTTCVEECPGAEIVQEVEDGKNPNMLCNINDNFNVTSCEHNCDAEGFPYFYDYISYAQNEKKLTTTEEISQYMTTQTCIYQTTIVMNRICFPSNDFLNTLGGQADKFKKKIEENLDAEALSEYVDSVKEGWPIILSSVFIAITIGFVYMVFVKWCAGVMIWLSIMMYHLLLAMLATFCYQRSQYYSDLEPPQTDDANTAKYMAYILWGVLVVSVICIACFYKKIQLAVAIIKTAADYVGDVKSTMVIPPIFSIITAFYWFVWIIGFIYLYSWGTVEKRPNSVFGTIVWPEGNQNLIWFYLFMGLWMNAFIQACCQFILVSTPTIWYFAQPDGNNLHAPVSKSVWRCFRYHLGSLAFGALLVAIIQTIRVVLAYIEEQANRTGWGQTQPMKCILRMAQCIAACFERFIKFINKNAYIQMAITGENFCYSARNACKLLWNNSSRASIIQGVGGIFIMIGEFLISLGCTFICFQVLNNVEPYKDYSAFFPCIMIFIISYTIACLFLNVYGCGIDAIFLAFCHDEELAKKKNMAMPSHCPEKLQDFFNQHTLPKEQAQKMEDQQMS